MSVESQHYESEVIEQFLRSDLPEAELRDVEQHIETCDSCRAALYETAADLSSWDEASEFLTSDEHDLALKNDDALVATEIRTTTDPSGAADYGIDVRQVIAWLAPTDDPAMLGRIGTYEIAGVVGAGGMGVVVKGFDRALNRYVAIKTLAPHLASSGAARRRFAREAQAAAAVVHDNVVAIHGVSEANGLPYLVMPYLRGTSLQKRIDGNGSLNVSEVLRIAMQTARGLAAAHDQGLVHRDIKPANILMDGTTERVLLTDFGLARAADDASLTHSGVIAGTPYFMSPEQAEGSSIDHRSDLFSLGSVMYAMCTGRPPFRAETSWGILRKVSDSTPTAIRELNSEIPGWLAGVISRLHEKSADDRFQSADEVADLLEQCLAHVQQPTVHALPDAAMVLANHERGPSWFGSKMAVAGGGVLCCLGLAIWMGTQAGLFDTSVPEVAAPSPPPEPTSRFAELPAWDDGTDELFELQKAIEKLDQETADFWK